MAPNFRLPFPLFYLKKIKRAPLKSGRNLVAISPFFQNLKFEYF